VPLLLIRAEVRKQMTARRILVIGATGTVGRHVVLGLRAQGSRVRAMTRNRDGADFPPDIEIVHGDLTIPDTLDGCLDGVDSLFLVWTAPAAATDAALARIATRARRIVFLSAPLKTPHPFFQQPNPARNLGLHIEQLIETSGLEWTFLRPGMFAANAREFWGPPVRAGNTVRWPYLGAPTAPIDERDIARVGVRALTESGHHEREYVLTGPQSLTQYEQIATVGEAIGRTLRIEEISPDEARREWSATLPLAVVNMLLEAWAAAMGQPAFVTSTVEEVTGTPARSFSDWARANVSTFQSLPPHPSSSSTR
jgi:uncharacterized protein YbjT (DUF2867 family)